MSQAIASRKGDRQKEGGKSIETGREAKGSFTWNRERNPVRFLHSVTSLYVCF